jgi:hypothetical protein
MLQPMKKTSVMSYSLPEQRRFARVSMPISAIVSSSQFSLQAHMARVRDINPLGAFFYCNLAVEVGQTLTIEFMFPDSAPVCCEGIVVRVEQGTEGSTGIAIQFSRYDFPKSSAQNVARSKNESKPFIAWTLDLVEQMFEVRPELRQCGAAA